MQKFRLRQLVALAAALSLHGWLIERVLVHPGTPGKPPMAPQSIVTVSIGPSEAEPPSAVPVDATPPENLASGQSEQLQSPPSANEPPAATSPLEDGPHYYKPRELSTPPILLQDVLQDQPIHPGGDSPKKLILHLYINPNGSVENVVPENSELSFEDTKLLVDKFMRMKFQPGIRDGSAVPVELKIEVEATSTH